MCNEWRDIETAPKDGTEVALLFANEEELHGRTYPRERAARWIGDWSIPYFKSNPPIGWQPLPKAPAIDSTKGGSNV